MMQSHTASRFSSPANLHAANVAIDACVGEFLQRMTAMQGHRIDLGDWAKYWAFDTNSKIKFGRPFGFMAKGGDISGIITGNDNGFRVGSLIGQVPWLNRFLLENKILMRLLNNFAGITDPTADFVDLIKEKVKEAEADETLEWCFLKWLRGEQKGSKKMDLDDATLMIHLTNYLSITSQAVIKEAMRLASTNNIPLERIVTPENLVISGYYLPAGTNVGTSAYIVHRDPSVYGVDADEFHPERWLDVDVSRIRRMQSHFFAFGRGERGCSGRTLAMLLVGKFTVNLLRTFDMEWASDNETWDLKTWWMPEQHGLIVKFKPLA
ncbi:MAG: hypothetical protein LQ342_006830 [Letrouitia transgressa]|nr:MAG: hypothetical protein LQ342_006830 [Letrouitia transgressa]